MGVLQTQCNWDCSTHTVVTNSFGQNNLNLTKIEMLPILKVYNRELETVNKIAVSVFYIPCGLYLVIFRFDVKLSLKEN